MRYYITIITTCISPGPSDVVTTFSSSSSSICALYLMHKWQCLIPFVNSLGRGTYPLGLFCKASVELQWHVDNYDNTIISHEGVLVDSHELQSMLCTAELGMLLSPNLVYRHL